MNTEITITVEFKPWLWWLIEGRCRHCGGELEGIGYNLEYYRCFDCNKKN